jgi:hypothetical protein
MKFKVKKEKEIAFSPKVITLTLESKEELDDFLLFASDMAQYSSIDGIAQNFTRLVKELRRLEKTAPKRPKVASEWHKTFIR